MRLFFLAFLLLASAATAQEDPLPAAPSWQSALRGDVGALAAAEELESILERGDLAALSGHFPAHRVRMMLPEAGIRDGLYGHAQSRALLSAWLEPLDRRVLRVSVVNLSEGDRRLSILFQWAPATPEDLLPRRQLVLELQLRDGGWTVVEVLAP